MTPLATDNLCQERPTRRLSKSRASRFTGAPRARAHAHADISEGAVAAPSDDLALLALALPALLARLRLAARRSLTACLVFRCRRRHWLFGPRLLLAATALSARIWYALLVSRGHGALRRP